MRDHPYGSKSFLSKNKSSIYYTFRNQSHSLYKQNLYIFKKVFIEILFIDITYIQMVYTQLPKLENKTEEKFEI